ncbi:hypothetical protein G6F22_022131 [Rhizopus arrhizus]|nr:hypothetical protein G6F22_022131 [Rhizopus arrhizus]
MAVVVSHNILKFMRVYVGKKVRRYVLRHMNLEHTNLRRIYHPMVTLACQSLDDLIVRRQIDDRIPRNLRVLLELAVFLEP